MRDVVDVDLGQIFDQLTRHLVRRTLYLIRRDLRKIDFLVLNDCGLHRIVKHDRVLVTLPQLFPALPLKLILRGHLRRKLLPARNQIRLVPHPSKPRLKPSIRICDPDPNLVRILRRIKIIHTVLSSYGARMCGRDLTQRYAARQKWRLQCANEIFEWLK